MANQASQTPGDSQLASQPISARRRQLWQLFGERHGTAAALVVSSLCSGLTEAGLLAILAQSAAALVEGSTKIQFEVGPMRIDAALGLLLGVAIGLALARLVLQVLSAFLSARIVADMQTRLRDELFTAFGGASWEEQARDKEGHLQELATNQVMQATQGALQATLLVAALSAFTVLVASALALNVVAALAVLVVAGGLLLLLRPLSGLGRRRAHALSERSIEYAGGVNEAVRLAEEIQVFGVIPIQRDRLVELVQRVRRVFFEAQLVIRLVSGVYQSLVYLLVGAGLIVLYATGAGHVASLGAVVLLLVRAGTYGQQAQSAYQVVRQALPYLERLEQARRRYAASAPGRGEEPLGKIRALAFEAVDFYYEPAQPVLSDVSFKVDFGEAVGIVGPSGAGKSTMVQILLGLRLPQSGHFLVNDVPAERFNREDWHRRVAYVPQQPRLLHATVADNICFFRSLDREMIERAAQLAGIHEDVMGWPQGYDTMVGPRADAVSGGQQQRICIARALASAPDVLLLDEPTSALDPHSESLIQQSLSSLRNRLTLFIVAHRMSTLTICERVMVIVDGQLQAFDRLSELEATSDYYRSASTLTRSASI